MFRLTDLVNHQKVTNQVLAFIYSDRNLDGLVEVRRFLDLDVGVYSEPSEHVGLPIAVVDAHRWGL